MKKLKKIWGFIKPFVPQLVMVLSLAVGFYSYTNQMVEIGKIEANKKFDSIQNELKTNQAEMKKYLDQNALDIKNHTDNRFNQIDMTKTEVHNTILKSAESEPRTTDENLGLTQDMLDAVNKGRAETRQ